MARGVTIEIQGLKELQKKLGAMPKHLVDETDAEMAAAANGFVNRAVEIVPVDIGVLRQSISSMRLAEMNYEVVAGARYAAYVEFGTITRVSVPADLVQYAAQFKGRGLRKSGGMAARPFFFPQLPIARAELNKNLKQMMERL
jgi:hypothetical protein